MIWNGDKLTRRIFHRQCSPPPKSMNSWQFTCETVNTFSFSSVSVYILWLFQWITCDNPTLNVSCTSIFFGVFSCSLWSNYFLFLSSDIYDNHFFFTQFSHFRISDHSLLVHNIINQTATLITFLKCCVSLKKTMNSVSLN